MAEIRALLDHYRASNIHGAGIFALEFLLELKQLVEAENTLEPEKLAKRLRGHRYQGVTGTVEFGRDGVTRRGVPLLYLEPGHEPRLKKVFKHD